MTINIINQMKITLALLLLCSCSSGGLDEPCNRDGSCYFNLECRETGAGYLCKIPLKGNEK